MNEPTAHPATAPVPSSSKTGLVVGISVAVLVLLALGYFFGVPAMQVRQQKSLLTRHKQIDDKLVKVYDSFKRDSFTKTDTDSVTEKNDAKIGLDAIKDARTAINDNATALTQFKAWPLLDWQKKYHDATQVDAQEETYVKDARTFLDNYEGLLKYVDQAADIDSGAEKVIKDMESISESDTPANIAKKLDTFVAQLTPIEAKAKALTPPDFIKEDHEADVKTIDRLITDIKQMAEGARKLDIGKITTASDDVQKATDEADARTKTFVTKLHTDSVIQKSIDVLTLANNDITRGYNGL